MIVLAGDIGGTKSILRLCNTSNVSPEIILEQIYPSQNYADFYELLDAFLSSCDIPSGSLVNACFAVAGPINGGSSKVTNLPWVIDESTLAKKYDFNYIKIINDFTALGYSLSRLDNDDITTIQAGLSNDGHVKTILGAGTGLGMCMVVSNNSNLMVLPSEFGNTTFAPSSKFSFELAAYMRKYGSRIAYEDILSGAGLENIYIFLKTKSRNSVTQPAISNEHSDLAAYISQSALAGEDYMAEQALDYFTEIYATAASDIALLTYSLGGLYIAGGIAPKITSSLTSTSFTKTFLENKKMHHILENIPIYIILNSKAGLLGAIEVAKQSNRHQT